MTEPDRRKTSTDPLEFKLAYARAIEMFEAKLAAARFPTLGDMPFGMDGDEGAIYLSGKRDALQWVLEMLP